MDSKVTLLVGSTKSQTRFEVERRILCTLPSLMGHLRSGVPPIINLSEEDPRLITVLLEYLHTQTYSSPKAWHQIPQRKFDQYPYNLLHGEALAANIALGDVIRLKIFHAEVYNIADRYNCVGLQELALKNVQACVVSSVPGYEDNCELLRYWCAIYDITKPKSRLRIPGGEYGVAGTRVWVRKLMQVRPDELVAACQNYPEFAVDMLNLVCKEG